jgi:hypothetical protein
VASGYDERAQRKANCQHAKDRRDETLERVGLNRTFELLRQLDENVASACKGLEKGFVMGDQAELLKQTMEQILAIDKKSLISRSDWGNLKFEAASDALESIYQIVGILSGLPYERLPDAASAQVREALVRTYTWIDKNNRFAIETANNPSAERDQIVQSLNSQEQDLYQASQQWIPFLAYLKGDIPRQLEDIVTSVAAAKSKDELFGKFVLERQEQFDKIISVAREASAKAGVGVFTRDFREDSEKRDMDASKWLRFSAGAAAATVAVAVLFFFVHPPSQTPALVQYVTSKVIVLSMLIAVTAWCAGNYKANKHQATVGRYKAHALQTFQAFVQASDDQSVRDAVLLETTRAIFAHSQSGYLKSEFAGESPAKMIEIIKTGVAATGA